MFFTYYLESTSLFLWLFAIQLNTLSMLPAQITFGGYVWMLPDEEGYFFVLVLPILLCYVMLSVNLLLSLRRPLCNFYCIIVCTYLYYLRNTAASLSLNMVISAALSRFFISLCWMGMCFFKKLYLTSSH